MRTRSLNQILGAIVIMLFFTVNAAAQDKAAEGARAVTSNMKDQLNLNDNQYTQLYAVNLDFLQKAIENQATGNTKVEKGKRLKELDDERDAKLKSVLNSDQFKKYLATKTDNRKKLRAFYQDKV